eukprot:403342867
MCGQTKKSTLKFRNKSGESYFKAYWLCDSFTFQGATQEDTVSETQPYHVYTNLIIHICIMTKNSQKTP